MKRSRLYPDASPPSAAYKHRSNAAIMESTLFRSLKTELETARKQFPENNNALMILERKVQELRLLLGMYDRTDRFIKSLGDEHENSASIAQGATAVQVYIAGLQVAVMALRIVDEGDPAFAYRMRERKEHA